MPPLRQLGENFFRVLNVEKHEESKVRFLLFQSFFIGIFFAIYDISASAIFLNAFESDMVSYAILISGLAGLFITSLYSRLLRKIKISRLLVLNLTFIMVSLLLMRLGFYFTNSKWLAFLIFIMMGPLNLVAVIGFWSMVGRLFTLRQGKRLFGMIDSGQIFGMILVSFAVPSFLLKLLNNQTKDLLFISAISIFITLFLQFFITKKYKLDITGIEQKPVEVEKEERKEKEGNFFSLFKSKYVRLMAGFILMSMAIAFFILHSFFAVSDMKYPDNVELTSFLGFFTATIMIFSFIFKTFVYSKFINTYGLKAGLLLMPVILGIFALLSSLVGTFMGYKGESTNFMIFFIMIALARLFSVSLKSSIQDPTFKVLYQSLDIKIRHRVQAGIDGIVNESAALLSGAILIGLGLFAFIELIHYSYFMVAFISFWIFITFQLHREYKKMLEKSIQGVQKQQEPIQGKNIKVLADKEETDERETIKYLGIIEKLNPIVFESKIKYYLEASNSEKILDYCIEKMQHLKIYTLVDKLRMLQEKPNVPLTIKEKAKAVISIFEEDLSILKDGKTLKSYLNSDDEKERAKAARLIGFAGDEDYAQSLTVLLRDIVPEVKINAIKAASMVKSIELYPVLIEFLNHPRFNKYAFDSLVKIGEPALNSLEQGFYKTGTSDDVLGKIVQIMGHIGGKKAMEYLLGKLNYHRSYVVLEALKSLKRCNFSPSNDIETRILEQVLKTTISITAWNLNTKNNINKNQVSPLLIDAIEEEIKSNYNLLFLILSLLYDAGSIGQIKNNIEQGSSESISYAVELLELFVDEEIKPYLFPLLEDIPGQERVKRLSNYYPLRRMETDELLKSIINRDINYLSRWTKVCAIYSYHYIEHFKSSYTLKAQIFNKDVLLRETTSALLDKLDKKTFLNCLQRLEPKTSRQLKNLINVSKSNYLLFDKIKFLKETSLFQELSSVILAEIAFFIEEIDYEENVSVFPGENDTFFPFYIIVDGTATVIKQNQPSKNFSNGEALDQYLFSDGVELEVKTVKPTKIFKIRNDNMIYLLNKHNSFSKTILMN